MIRPDLEEDYENNYPDGYREDHFSRDLIPVGKCHRMCPSGEIMERERCNRIHKYEMEPGSNPLKADLDRCMKEFRRPCVGNEIPRVIDLRPWSLLRKSLHHLLLNICLKEDDWMYVCDFVRDRLKAIRQDMVIQRIEGKRYIEVLEGSIRFLVYSLYKLTCTLKDFSCVIPMEQMIRPFGPVTGLDNYQLHVVQEMKLTTSCLRDCLMSLMYQYKENVPDSPNRPLFEAINLFANLPFLDGHRSMCSEFLGKKDLRNSNSMFKLVAKIYKHHLSGNDWTGLKFLPQLVDYPLLILAYAPALARLQVSIVQMLKTLYGPSKSSVSHLAAILCPPWLEIDDDQRIRFAKFIAIQMGIYDRNLKMCDYKLDNQRHQTIQRSSFDENLEMSNDTRSFALQMICGRTWSFYRDLLTIHGIEEVLSPVHSI